MYFVRQYKKHKTLKKMKKIYLLFTLILFIAVKSNAQSWTPWGLTPTLGNLTTGVKAMAISPYDGSIYVGGDFMGTINYLAKYNSSTNSWEQVGTGISGPVSALKFFKNKLYVGGLFTTAGGITVNNVASVNTAGTFSSVGVGLNEQVNCFYSALDSSVLYAGGKFSQDFSGTTTLLHVAQWNLSSWSAVGNGVNAVVNCLAQYNSKLYAGTENTSGSVSVLNASTWSTMTDVKNGSVYALETFGNYLYVGGSFQLPYFGACKFDGTNWNSITTIFSNGISIRSFHKTSNALYLGGNFQNAGVGNASYLAKIDNTTQPIKIVITGNNPAVIPYAISSKDGYIYLAVNFSSAGNNVLRSSSTIGIDEINSIIENALFYPNPMSTSGALKVTLKNHASQANLSIYDSQGRIVDQLKLQDFQTNELNFTIDKGSKSQGLYYYLLNVDGQPASSNSFVIE